MRLLFMKLTAFLGLKDCEMSGRVSTRKDIIGWLDGWMVA